MGFITENQANSNLKKKTVSNSIQSCGCQALEEVRGEPNAYLMWGRMVRFQNIFLFSDPTKIWDFFLLAPNHRYISRLGLM